LIGGEVFVDWRSGRRSHPNVSIADLARESVLVG